jgi:RimJ/RimL family protein N-acetyltransferase
MRLSVWHDNAAAIALYRTLGFQFHGEHNGYHELEWPAVAGDRRSLVSQEAATHE